MRRRARLRTRCASTSSLSLESRELDLLRIGSGGEGKLAVVEGGIGGPAEAGGEGRTGGIRAIHDCQLARKWPVAVLDPDLPVHLRLTEGVVRGLDAVDRGRAQHHRRLQALCAIDIIPAKQVFERQADAVF